MAKVHAPLLAFNRGEVSKQALCRVDNERLRLAAESQVNWAPYTLGAMMLRPGTGYLFSTKSDAAAFPIPFVYGFDDTALLELTDSHLQVIVNDVKVTRPSVATAVTNGDFSSSTGWTLAATSGCTADINSSVSGALYLAAIARGGVVSCLRSVSVAGGDQNVAHALRIVVTRGPVTFMCGSTSGGADYIARTTLDTGTHSLAFTPTGATFYVKFESSDRRGKIIDSITVEAAGTLDLPTPWVAADLGKLRFDQSGDIVFIACDGYQQRKIERRDNNSWSVVIYQSDDGPFSFVDTQSVTLTPSVYEGNGTLTASGPFFTDASTDVGRLFRIFSTGQTNQTVLGGSDVFSEPIRVSGVGNDRKFGWNVSGVWAGRITLQRSVESRDSGFVDVAFTTVNALTAQDDTVSYNNVICWYRVGFKAGDYTSGSATVYFGQNVASAATTVGPSTVSGANSFTAALQLPSTLGGIGRDPSERNFNADIRGNLVGIVSLQQSLTSSDGPWTTIATYSNDGAIVHTDQVNDGQGAVDAWYRLGVETGNYTSGNATLTLSLSGRGLAGGSSLNGAAALASGRFGICRVTGVTSSTIATIEVLTSFSEIVASGNWQGGDWIPGNWPNEVRFFEGRLWWFRGDRRWGSVSDDYYDFSIDAEGDSATINRSFGSGPVDRINFTLDLAQLIIGREMSIDPVRASAQGETLTPTNNTAKSCATKGAARLPALKVGSRGVYVEKSGRRIYQLLYSLESGDYVGDDLTKRNLDIGAQGFVSLAVQEQPDTQLHFVRGDGQDAILLFDPGDEVECLWRAMTLGVIERVVTLPGSQEDNVYYIVKRTINGSTKRFWEKQAKRTECIGGSLNKHADAHVTISQASSTTIGGLSHLEGESVVVWANGKDLGAYTVTSAQITGVSEAVTSAIVGLGGTRFTYDSSTAAASVAAAAKYNGYPAEVYANGPQGGKLRYVGAVTVAGGVITLPNGKTAKKIIAFLGLVAPFRSAKLAYGAQMGTALTQKKKLGKIGLILYDTHYQGLTYGSDIGNMQPLPLSAGGQDIAADSVFDEHEEPMVGLAGSWDTDSRLHLLAQAPRPATVAGVVIEVETSESR